MVYAVDPLSSSLAAVQESFLKLIQPRDVHMSYFSFIPEELEALTGLRHEAQLIYLKVIVPNRNRHTCIAKGRLPEATFSVTYPSMQAALTVDGRQGVKGEQVDKSFCRRVMGELERAGLIESVGADLSAGVVCKLFAQYKAVHFSNSKKPDTIPTPKDNTIPTPEKADNSASYSDNITKADTLQTPKADTFTDPISINQSIRVNFVLP